MSNALTDGAPGDEDAQALPRRLRQLRMQEGLTQRQMAAALGLSAHSSVADFEAGRRIPHNDILIAYERRFALAGNELRLLRQRALAVRARSREPSTTDELRPVTGASAAPSLAPLDAQAPATVGGFRLVGRIGVGSCGPVYSALTAAGESAAVKISATALAADPDFRSRLAVEAAALGKLSTPRVAELIDADAEASRPWVALRYAQGPALSDVIGVSGPLPAGQVSALAVALAEAVAQLRAVGVAHAGLGPSRIRLSSHGPQLVDTGMRRAAAGTAYARALTADPAFLAPEQISGSGADQATDVFVLGVVLAYAATGRLPFSGPPGVLRADPAPESVACADEELTALILRCLSKDPRDRPGLAEVTALRPGPARQHAGGPRRLASGQPGVVGPPPRTTALIRRGTAALVLAGAVGMALGLETHMHAARPAAHVSSDGRQDSYDAFACVNGGGSPPTVRLAGNPRDLGWRSSTPWPWGTPSCASQIWWAPYLNGGANPYVRFSWIFQTSIARGATCIVWAYYPPPPSGHSGGMAHYTVHDGAGTTTRQIGSIEVAQSRYKGSWHELGGYRIASGTLAVTLDNSGTGSDPEQGPIVGPLHASCRLAGGVR